MLVKIVKYNTTIGTRYGIVNAGSGNPIHYMRSDYKTEKGARAAAIKRGYTVA